MKNFTLFIFLLVFSTGFSQNAPVTFENGEFGSTWTFTTFENGTGAGFSKVANPFQSGINTSATVGKFVAGTTASGAAPYAGFETAHASGVNGIGTFTLSASNSIIKILVYKSVVSDVGIKFAIANGGAQQEIKVPNTKINQWEELTFDFSGKIGLFETINIDQIIFFLDFNARTGETTSYFDKVTFSAKPGATVPTVAATTPSLAATDVISLFSNAYTNVPVDNWRADWGQSGNVLSDIQIAGNDTKKYTEVSYFGVITEASKIDASAMLNFHIDVWTPDVTTFKIKIVDFGADGAYQGGDDKEFEVTRTLTLSGWNSLEIPLSEFTGLTTKAHVAQFVFSGTAGTIYIDNVYFNKTAVVVPPPPAPYAPVTFETSQFGSTWAFATFENGSGSGYSKVANPFPSGINSSATVGKFVAGTTASGAAPYAGFETAHASGVNGIGTFTLNASNSIIKIMVYKTVISDVAIKFAIANGGAQPDIKVPNTKINEWEELTFDFSGKIGLFETINIDQMIFFLDFNARTAETTSYFDNVTFSAKAAATAPTVAAPTPPARVATDVKSIFSDAYATYKAGDWSKAWSQTTDVTIELIAGNNTRKLANFNYQGITLPASEVFDLSDMTTMHVDLWSSSATSIKINLINQGPVEAGVILTIAAGWNSFDMALNAANFPGINLSTVFQMSMSSTPTGTTVYLDNFYFYKSTVVVVPKEPTVAAPTPTTAAANVIPLFSNAYTNVPVTTWRTDWSVGSALTDLQIAGNDTKKYTNLNYFGVDVTGTINANQMLYFHIDVWTPDLTAFKVKLVDFGANGVYQGGDDVEFEVTRTPTLSGWNSFDIPLSAFTGLTTKGNIAQLVLSGAPVGTVYIDNVYFSKTISTLGIANFETSNVKMYPNPVTDYFTIEANGAIDEVTVYNVLGQEILVKSPKSNATTIQTSDLQKGVYIIKMAVDGKVTTAKIIKN
jgi:hypothetical protein